MEYVHNLTNQYFPNDRVMTLQDHKWVKSPFKFQERSMDFSVTDSKIFSNPTRQPNFKNLPLAEFSSIHNFLKKKYYDSSTFPSYIPVKNPVSFLSTKYYTVTHLSQK